MGPVRGRACLQWSEESMLLAIDAVVSGCPFRKASSMFDVPVATLHRRLKIVHGDLPPRQRKQGRKTFFTVDEETYIADILHNLQTRGVPLTETIIFRAAFQISRTVGKEARFKQVSRKNGPQWLNGFLERNARIKVDLKPAKSKFRVDSQLQPLNMFQSSGPPKTDLNAINYPESKDTGALGPVPDPDLLYKQVMQSLTIINTGSIPDSALPCNNILNVESQNVALKPKEPNRTRSSVFIDQTCPQRVRSSVKLCQRNVIKPDNNALSDEPDLMPLSPEIVPVILWPSLESILPDLSPKTPANSVKAEPISECSTRSVYEGTKKSERRFTKSNPFNSTMKEEEDGVPLGCEIRELANNVVKKEVLDPEETCEPRCAVVIKNKQFSVKTETVDSEKDYILPL